MPFLNYVPSKRALRVVFGFLLVCVLAPQAVASPDWLPRSTMAYAKVNAGHELTTFLDTRRITGDDEEANAEYFGSALVQALNGFTGGHAALVNLGLGDGGPKPIFAAFVNYDQPRDIKWLMSLTGKEIPDGEIPPAKQVGDAQLYELDKEFLVAFKGTTVILCNNAGTTNTILDAANFGAEPEERLTANPRFQRWQSTVDVATAQLFVDGLEIKRWMDRVVADNMRVDSDIAPLIAMREWAQFDKLEFFSMWFTPGANGTGGAKLTFSEASRVIRTLPAQGGINTLKYLPKSTFFFTSTHTGEADKLWQQILRSVGELNAAIPEGEGGRRSGRDIFDERLRSAATWFEQLDDPAIFFGGFLALRAQKANGGSAFSGSAEELAKLLGMEVGELSVMGFSLTHVEEIGYDPSAGERFTPTGKLHFKDSQGMGVRLLLDSRDVQTAERLGGLWGADLPDPLPAPRMLSVIEAMDGAINLACLGAGLSRRQASAALGTDVTFGFAPNGIRLGMRAGGWGGDITDMDNHDVFVAVGMRDPDLLLSKMLEMSEMLPAQARAQLLTVDEAGNSVPRYAWQTKHARVLVIPGEISLALTRDALLIAPPHVMPQMLEQRGLTVAGELGVSAQEAVHAVMGVRVLPVHTYLNDRALPVVNYSTTEVGPMTGSLKLFSRPSELWVQANHSFEDLSFFSPVVSSVRWFMYREADIVQAARAMALPVYRLRLSDKDPDNDRFPTFKEALALVRAAINDEDDKDDTDDGAADEATRAARSAARNLEYSEGQSGFFDGPLEDQWIILPPLADDAEMPFGIVAISVKAIDGRFLAIGSDAQMLSISSSAWKAVHASIESKSLDRDALRVEKNLQLTDVEAAIFLQSHWLSKGRDEIRSMAREGKIKQHEGVHIEGVGYFKVLRAEEGEYEVRIEGFGHWMEVDSTLGIIGTSWSVPGPEGE